MNKLLSRHHFSQTILLALLILLIATACNLQTEAPNRIESVLAQETASTTIASETIPPYTPLATLTPSQTLRPPPTFELPTATRPATATPSITPTSTIDLSVSIPGLRGAETPTPTSTQGCAPRQDWKLRYTVKRDDALEKIANLYNTTIKDLMEGNCLTDANVIRIDQELRVPGESAPVTPYVCEAWELLTAADGTLAIECTGYLTFYCRCPRAARNLIRIIKPDGGIFEIVLELRQNEMIDVYEKIPMAGTYTWYVYPLDSNFVQIPCKEGGPWTFTKAQSPTATPTPTPFP